MIVPLAKAEATDASGENLVLILISLGIIAGAVVLAMVPFIIARARRHPSADSVRLAGLAWAVLAAASAIHTVTAQMNWSREYLLLVQSGYYDPQQTADAPKPPWISWGVLGAGYAGLILWPTVTTARPRNDR